MIINSPAVNTPLHFPFTFFMVDPIQPMDGYLLLAGNIFAGGYCYLWDLMAIDQPTQLNNFARDSTPMKMDRLLLYLSSHPDRVHNTFTLTSHMAFVLDLTGMVTYYIQSL